MHHLQKLEGAAPKLNASLRVYGSKGEFHWTAAQRATSASSATSVPDRNYLQRSSVPSYHFQRSLPRLPIPALDKTCERYLKALDPLVSPEQHRKSVQLTVDFQKKEGKELHEELLEQNKHDKHTSYITGPWFDMYLKDRRPVVITHNPFIAFQDDPRPEYNNQLLRAANMVVSSARFMKSLKEELLEPEVYHLNPKASDTEAFRRFVRMLPQSVAWYGAYWYKAFPLDMSQYHRLFNSTRIPRPDKDELFSDPLAKHLLVMRKGNFYTFNIFDCDGNIVDEREILAHLQYILTVNDPPPCHPLGLLTTADRDTWASARVKLINADPTNVVNLRLLDSAAFCLNLDDEPVTDPNKLARSFLFSDGVNRWFDKSFQLMVSNTGTSAINFEHAWGDGVAVMRYFKELYQDTTNNPFLHPDSVPARVDSCKIVKKLDFKLTPFLEDTISKLREAFNEKTSCLDMDFCENKALNKPYIKQHKLSPDSVMQLVVQLAQYRLTGHCVGTYESCSTAAFKHGRTETIRPCTKATHAVCKLLLGPGPGPISVEEVMSYVKECTAVHNQLTKEAAMGQGFDRHLFALKKLAEDKGQTPELFTDEGYRTMTYDILSTSTLPEPSVMIGGFCPVVPDGYGVGYAIQDRGVGFNVTSYTQHRDATAFVKSLQASLDDIHTVLEGRLPSKRT